MKQLHKILLALLVWGVAATGNAFAQSSTGTADTIVAFRFLPGKDMFTLKGNEAELARLYALVDEYRTRIAAGEMPVYVDGYCASLPTTKENLTTASIRANRVQSELITHQGLKEADFVTVNHAFTYHINNNMVVVTLHIPAPTTKQSETDTPTEVSVPVSVEPASPMTNEPEQVAEQTPEPAVPTAPKTLPAETYRFAVRTNLLYDAFLLPTIGVEWRVNPDWGVKLDGSLAWWGSSKDKVQKVWLLNPEVRRYLLRDRRFYVGVSGSYGEYNLYKYPVGSLFSKDTGYQGTVWSAGLTVGYQLCLSHRFSVDFNLGLGYARSEYDSYGMTDGVRIYKAKDRSKNFWGPTQAGINLVWTIGGNK